MGWADSFRPNADAWFDRQVRALDEFEVTLTFCFIPEHRGVAPYHPGAPLEIAEYADFCAQMVLRYAPARQLHARRNPATHGLPSDERSLAGGAANSDKTVQTL